MGLSTRTPLPCQRARTPPPLENSQLFLCKHVFGRHNCVDDVPHAHAQVGGIRRIIVPVELGYPNGDFKKLGPKPSTFAVRKLSKLVQTCMPGACRIALGHLALRCGGAKLHGIA
jgi:hypothetical protein